MEAISGSGTLGLTVGMRVLPTTMLIWYLTPARNGVLVLIENKDDDEDEHDSMSSAMCEAIGFRLNLAALFE
jgi:hypothetical protein